MVDAWTTSELGEVTGNCQSVIARHFTPSYPEYWELHMDMGSLFQWVLSSGLPSDNPMVRHMCSFPIHPATVEVALTGLNSMEE